VALPRPEFQKYRAQRTEQTRALLWERTVSVETERKTKELLTGALAAKDAQDVERVLGELRRALHEHILHAKVSLGPQASLFEPETPQQGPTKKAKSASP
jgi:hypothetical protein